MNLKTKEKIFNSLKKYGFTTEESLVFFFIYQNSFSSVLEISRAIKISRTKTYSIIEKLLEKNFLEKVKGERGDIFKTSSLSVFNEKNEEKIIKLKNQEKDISSLVKSLKSLNKNPNPKVGVTIKYFSGISGIQQMTWNSLKAKGELLTYEFGNLDSFIGDKAYAEKLRKKFVENKINIKTLMNIKKQDSFTKVYKMIEKFYKWKYIPKKVLDIKTEFLIYNNTYSLYDYTDPENIYGIEINDKNITKMQKEIFYTLWKQAQKTKFLEKGGGSEVVK